MTSRNQRRQPSSQPSMPETESSPGTTATSNVTTIKSESEPSVLSQPDSHETTTAVNSPFSVNLDPYTDVLDRFKTGLKRIPQPQSINDLFEYHYRLVRLIQANKTTKLLLNPLPSDAPFFLRRLSSNCQVLMQEHLTDTVERVANWETETYEFLQQLKKLTPSVLSKSFTKHRYPDRQSNETLDEYLLRFELWQARSMPDPNQDYVWFCASIIWHSHIRLYVTSDLPNSFYDIASQFRTMSDVYQWFRQQKELIQAPGKLAIRAKGKRQTFNNKSKPQIQVSSQDSVLTPRPLPANQEAGPTYKNPGKVTKQGKSKFKWNKSQQRNASRKERKTLAQNCCR